MSSVTITPDMIERRLKELSKEVDNSHTDLAEAEKNYFETKAKYELSLAHARLSVASKKDIKVTVSDKADLALVATEDLHMKMATAEALVRAARANASRIRTQVDIARSIGTSVRTSMELV
jgi:hypothetical protein